MLKHIQANGGCSTLERRRGLPCNGSVGTPRANGSLLSHVNTPAARSPGTLLPNRSHLSCSLHSGFNASSLSTGSKRSATTTINNNSGSSGGGSGSSGDALGSSPCQTATTRTTGLDQSREPGHPALAAATATANTTVNTTADLSVLDISRRTLPPHALSCSSASRGAAAAACSRLCRQSAPVPLPRDAAVRRMLLCLALLCLSSLLLAILAAIFLLKVTPLDVESLPSLVSDADSESDSGSGRSGDGGGALSAETRQYLRLYEVTVALTALSVCLDLCCLLVCSTQLVLCVKLTKSTTGDQRIGAYLRESSPSRIFAMVGYFLSIPVFLSGVVLYTFLHFHSTSAVTTSAFLALGILFCAGATAHNIGVWHRVRRSSAAKYHLSVVPARGVAASTPSRHHHHHHQAPTSALGLYGNGGGEKHTGLPSPTLDLSLHANNNKSNVSHLLELSTLV